MLVAPLTTFVRCSFIRCFVCYSALLPQSIKINYNVQLCSLADRHLSTLPVISTSLPLSFADCGTCLRSFKLFRLILSLPLLRQLRPFIYPYLLPSASDCVWAFSASDSEFIRQAPLFEGTLLFINLQNGYTALRDMQKR